MDKIKVEDAIGMTLVHDLTKIVPGEYKGPAFKRGHIIRKEDIEALKHIGKNHINILELIDGNIHEDEAAIRISRALACSGVYFTEPSEGKVEIRAKHRGMVKINVETLNKINEIDEIIVATIHTNTLVEAGEILAATRIIPLSTSEEKIFHVESIAETCQNNVIKVVELEPKNIAIVVTGTEVYEGRIKDGFAPVMKEKIRHYGCNLLDLQYCPDEQQKIEAAINEMMHKGADIVLCCGGMSVDADDVTPCAIRNCSQNVVSYGIPVIPGNMLMLAYNGKTAILGIPAAAIFLKTTSMDMILPRLLAGDKITRKELSAYGHGGLCIGCKTCVYPMCPYGK